MFKHLLAQRITRYNEQWYCYLCKSSQSCLKEVKSHMQETHLEQINTTNQILTFLEKSDISRKQCIILLDNGIVLKNLPHDYFCVICQCSIPTLIHVYEHVKGKKHEMYKKANTKEKNHTTVQQNLSEKQNLVNVGTTVKFIKQFDNFVIIKPSCTSRDQLAKSLDTNDNNSVSDCIKLNNELQDYFCKICKCCIPTLNHVNEHVKGKNHQKRKRTSITKENPRNDPKSSNNNKDDNISTSEKVNTSETQIPIDTMDTLFNISNIIDMPWLEHNTSKPQEIQCIDNVQLPVVAADTSKQDIIEHKKTTPGLFMSHDISREMNTSLSTMCLSNTKVTQNRSPAERYNRMYPIEYLLFEEIMFSCREWKLREIRDNLQCYMPSTGENVYCLLCHVEHNAYDIQLWYDHVSSENHALRNHNSMLLKQLIARRLESTNLKCYACNEIINHDMISIDVHINGALHKMSLNVKLIKVEYYYHGLLIQTLDPLCYAIQYFACVPCRRRFKAKIEFIDHLYVRHQTIIIQQDSRGFDFCLTCSILWYDFKCYYLRHCEDPIHRYLKHRIGFAVQPLSQEVTELLKCIDENVAALLKLSEDASAKLNTSRIIKDLKCTLKSHYSSAIKVRVYGSRYTGLALSNSDIDIYLDFGDECTKAELIKSRSKQIEECLRADYEVWKIQEILENTRTPIIRLIHISTGINCDISYTNGLSVQNSKFIKSLNQAYLPCRKLILFLKKWMQLCNINGSQKITSYGLVWLVIFYLQVKHGIPSVASLIKKHKKLKIISGWRTGVSDTLAINVPELSMHKLLLGFFEYYGEFDYIHSVVCPLLGNECNKQLFASLDKEPPFPEDMRPYLTHLQGLNPEYFRIDSVMCVQDPFVLSFNITRAVQVLTVRSFKEYCKESASQLMKLHFADR